MLAAANYYKTTVLFVLIQRSFSAMVLPRPPSSPNHIQHIDRRMNDRNLYEGKPVQDFSQNPNIERTNTNDYSLVEIELQSPDEMDTTNLQNIVHAMLKQSEKVHNNSYPNPEVIPHSIFGVRDVGLTSTFKLNTFNEDRRVLIESPKIPTYDEKLYYLKNNRPKVYVNVRGHSGTFRKDPALETTSTNDAIGFLRVTPPFQRQTNSKSRYVKKNRSPKKYDRNHGHQRNRSWTDAKRLNRLASIYNFEAPATTEGSMVTSSELPKQIPAPPSKFHSRTLMAQTTPVQNYALRRTDVLPGYSFS
ncbi:uncharacterized protein LOC117602447 [Osmia lignaria lignaria]|uniref:uncharacterized protein LOC117602447 n=1 Tax=Osmia lignaria lignaria TaxID=1437193 RepID=UPI00147936DD|nr:uncharacterized protein LOC117602447 [Osmia lignaria]XP_034176381.1 uncharacterized protein LOC117602447 [Osmia lignaria]